jgi:hypothetical protein
VLAVRRLLGNRYGVYDVALLACCELAGHVAKVVEREIWLNIPGSNNRLWITA